uniref:Reverse transcriptase/retrotransposon-derived protein RNase H-like domain-containing protein n=1 Tax=Cyprinus carpio TaxID=7962 RepID=A0A8C1S3S0_CYPCA
KTSSNHLPVHGLVTPDGISPDPRKVEAVTEFRTPTDVKQVRGFLGLTSYYRQFIPSYAQKAESLFKLTRKETPFNWDDGCQASMDYLKNCLTSKPILCLPDFSRPFFIHTDACDLGLGAALMQKDDMGRDVVVAFASRTLHKAERPYSTPEKECLGVIWALEHFRPYIEDALSRNPLPHCEGPIDILPPHAVIAGMDLRSL